MQSINLSELPSLVGVDLAPSKWVSITQEQIDRFADLTGDDEWIHIDRDRAAREFGGTIAHGYHLLALIPALGASILEVRGVKNGLNYGINRLRFTNMVRAGVRVRLRRKLLSVEPQRGGWMTTHEFIIEIAGEERPAMVAEMLFLLFGDDEER
ncbi:MaoC family dehydratase [Sphingopyxis sp. GW247-27LB]|uniref:MaoC family dehydratase n=1 Tax=Sphingopyxis sp. GW247-27LB TaxID=2012632 RepID=UPI000BA5164D|nr:MaoC family dehydratase [Sphingopyxis sp. GW247-27LB]PAL24208.1 enoyl-CoA hydratase [Sphingopyxis sp. GW247-27LB]